MRPIILAMVLTMGCAESAIDMDVTACVEMQRDGSVADDVIGYIDEDVHGYKVLLGHRQRWFQADSYVIEEDDMLIYQGVCPDDYKVIVNYW